ncbi:PTS fructose transporter subunit IIA [candidate division WOR-3 bacterium]|uniref:PTS fructose transporter subunit IIA n=1 Tax=candidate division WOR-3 bacterium TaxID=2052148 RepID=A0A9D5KAC8_UNCW3|nr:PTS fructose transporter subunit IIA [candidate division WOR-3 bacterium]MBD3365418.1 PTS fructose transporter subunit IIA [candidate division WOR-3 bacterium]
MIRISEAICKEGIILNLAAREKVAVIKELVAKLAKLKLIDDSETFLSDILKRENLESTGIGLGVAIPHARTKAASGLILTYGYSKKGVDFNSLDGKPSHFIFLIAAPEDQKTRYIMALARLSKTLRKEETRTRLAKAGSAQEVVEILKEVE